LTQKPQFEVAIIGTGFGGLGIGIRLKTSGIDSFVIFEKADDVAGVWRENSYPGCACDIESVLYSYSFKPSRKWSKMYAPAAEIREYLRDCADSFKLWPHIRLNTQVTEANFDTEKNFWTIQTAKESITARYLISAPGGFSNPAIPVIEGMATFKGKAFHSARWDHGCDLKGKTVAVVGSGASGLQIIPELAKVAKKLYLFQRTPPWVTRKPNDREFSGLEKYLLRKFALYHWVLRKWIFLRYEIHSPLYDLRFNRFYGGTARRMLEKQVRDPETRKKLTPDYRYACKRLLFSNEYLKTFNQPNVEVVTDKILRIENSDLITDQKSVRDVDVIVYATGFWPVNRNGDKTVNVSPRITFRGKNGIDLGQTFMRNGRAAYFGMTFPDFPNLFFILGPNSGISHNSLLVQMESQFTYIVSCIKYMKSRGASSFEVKIKPFQELNAFIQNKMKKMVYLSGCQSFLMGDDGKVFMVWPFSTLRYRFMTRKFDAENYELKMENAKPLTNSQRNGFSGENSPTGSV
jgi:cation diffusion facilitator CzcD-associated flavoprotein CzcO